jgi:hypothetical protein
VFDSETEDEGVIFFSAKGTNDLLSFTPLELKEAIEQSSHMPSSINDRVKTALGRANPDAEEIELDFTVIGWEFIFQDIVKRSAGLSHISVMASFTCTRMRIDGFGGMVTLITPEEILSTSTNDILENWLANEFP